MKKIFLMDESDMIVKGRQRMAQGIVPPRDNIRKSRRKTVDKMDVVGLQGIHGASGKIVLYKDRHEVFYPNRERFTGESMLEDARTVTLQQWLDYARSR